VTAKVYPLTITPLGEQAATVTDPTISRISPVTEGVRPLGRAHTAWQPSAGDASPQARPTRLSRLTSGASRSSLIVLTMRLTSMTLNLVVQVVMARVMGLADFGSVNTVLAILNILVLPAALGYDVASIRFVALARRDQLQLRALTLRVARILIRSAVVVSLLVAGAALIEHETGHDGFAIGLALLIVATPGFALVRVGEGWLRGFGSVVRAQINSGVVMPALSIVLLLAQMPFIEAHRTIGVAGAMGARAVATVIAGCIVVMYVRRRLGGRIHPHSNLDNSVITDMNRAAIVLCGVGFLSMVISQIDIVAVSYLRGASAAGVYSAASRVAAAMNVCIIAVSFVLAPHVAHLFAEGKRSQLQDEVGSATSWSIGLMICACAILIPASPFLLGIFGSEFGASVTPLRILMLGQVASAACGPVAMVLSMTGKQRLAVRALAVATLVQMILLATLIPLLGIIGAACATTACTVIWNVAMVAYARRDLGIWVLPHAAARVMP
jgi:O-antigen/teichoic acid export membrane protein